MNPAHASIRALPRMLSRARPRAAGFTLVEIMVAMVIGLIGTIVIFQVYAVSESQRRTTTGGSDAQISGNIALFSMEREIRLGGYGFAGSDLLSCTVQGYDATRGATFTFPMVPVEITHAAAGDTISVTYGNSAMVVSGRAFTATSATSNTYVASPRTGYSVNDVVIAAGTGGTNACVLGQITAVPTGSGESTHLTHAANTGRYNHTATISGPTSGTLYNLGALPRRTVFFIQSNNLVARDDIQFADADANGANDTVDVSDGIVNLQAQYGIDANNDGNVTTAEFTDTAPANAAAWALLRAVRVGILARSLQFDKTQVTTTAPTWSGGTFTMTNLDGSAGTGAPTSGQAADNWRNYRYRVYETVIPLRNMIWR